MVKSPRSQRYRVASGEKSPRNPRYRVVSGEKSPRASGGQNRRYKPTGSPKMQRLRSGDRSPMQRRHPYSPIQHRRNVGRRLLPEVDTSYGFCHMCEQREARPPYTEEEYQRMPRPEYRAGVIPHFGEAFVASQSYGNKWGAPAGSPNGAESPHKTAARELFEETHLRAHVPRDADQFRTSDNRYFFLVEMEEPMVPVLSSEIDPEISNLAFLTPSHLDQLHDARGHRGVSALNYGSQQALRHFHFI